MILGGDSEDGVLYVLVLVDLCLIKGFVKIWRVVILVGDSDTNKLGHCKKAYKTKELEGWVEKFEVGNAKMQLANHRVRSIDQD